MGCPSTSTSALWRPSACQALWEAASISRDCPSWESKRRTSNRSIGRCSAALWHQPGTLSFLSASHSYSPMKSLMRGDAAVAMTS